jgi:hypothetical protein
MKAPVALERLPIRAGQICFNSLDGLDDVGEAFCRSAFGRTQRKPDIHALLGLVPCFL